MDTTIPSDLVGTQSQSSSAALPDVDPSFDEIGYVGSPKFHQVIRCPRTKLRVTFSEGGPRDGAPLLFCLPSFCSRYIGGPSFEEHVAKAGVRLIAIDRPGSGGTERCELSERLEISAQHVLSVLEYLGIRRVALLCHSAGVIHALYLLNKYPDLVYPNRVYFVSPWCPTSVSKNRTLQLIPSFLVTVSHIVLPTLAPAINAVERAFTFSGDLFKSSDKKKDAGKDYIPPERFRAEDGSEYRPQPPYHEARRPSERILKMFNRCTMSEPLQGSSQEFLLSLGRGGGVDEEWYRRTVAEIAQQLSNAGRTLIIEVWWAGDDGLIPAAGRKWFDDLLRARKGEGIEFHSFELPDMAHDDPLKHVEVICAIFEDVRLHISR